MQLLKYFVGEVLRGTDYRVKIEILTTVNVISCAILIDFDYLPTQLMNSAIKEFYRSFDKID